MKKRRKRDLLSLVLVVLVIVSNYVHWFGSPETREGTFISNLVGLIFGTLMVAGFAQWLGWLADLVRRVARRK